MAHEIQLTKIARELIGGFIRATGGGKPEAFDVIFTDVNKQDWAAGYAMMSEKYPDK
jgi:phenylpyruvate tautomerase PptA (4-oxalocrotonate tautomerase family)